MIRPKLWTAGHKLYNKTDMNPDNSAQPNKYNNPLEVMSPGERTICEITRHPFGLIGMYLTTGLIILVVMVAALAGPHFVTSISAQAKVYIFLAGIGISVLTLLYLYVGRTVYTGNRWIVTSDSITQVSQTSLFSKQNSQLSLANLEDVTFEQNSFIQTMFGFGTLKVETAGERSKFSFPFCPRPASCAREIIQAHEDFIRQNPEDAVRSSGLNVNTASASNPQQVAAAPAPAPVNNQPMGYSVPNGDDDDQS